MKRNALLLVAPLGALIVLALPLQGDTPAVGRHHSPVTKTIGAAQGGMRVYIDPSTGQVKGVPPQRLAPGSYSADRFSTSHEGLREVPAPVGGGKMVNLQGRFQQAYGAYVDSEGDLVIGCGLKEITHKAEVGKEAKGGEQR